MVLVPKIMEAARIDDRFDESRPSFVPRLDERFMNVDGMVKHLDVPFGGIRHTSQLFEYDAQRIET